MIVSIYFFLGFTHGLLQLEGERKDFMIVSSKGRYALHVLLDMAEHPTDDYIPIKEIAERQEISKEYLNNILKILVQNNLLLSLRGKGGGYKLVDTPEHYSVGKILRAAEGDLAPVQCVSDKDPCPRAGKCRSLAMWKKLDHMINDYLDSITLADLMEDETKTNVEE